MKVCWKTKKVVLVILSNISVDLRLQSAEQVLLYCKGKLNGKNVVLGDPKLFL